MYQRLVYVITNFFHNYGLVIYMTFWQFFYFQNFDFSSYNNYNNNLSNHLFILDSKGL